MTTIAVFTCNPFQENTYILHDETNECIIIDPGCYTKGEKELLATYIETNNLHPVRLINTHCHLDHVFGNNFVAQTYSLGVEAHEKEVEILEAAPQYSLMFGVAMEPSPMPEKLINEGDIITFGNTNLEAIFTPGHSPGSLSFYCKEEKYIISGDVLFQGSIGRTDLPKGDFETLIKSIKEKLLLLEDDVKVYSGHGAATTIGEERASNPFLLQNSTA